jgi:hypothetical protein
MTHKVLKVAAASAILALTAANIPARADDSVQNLGPVGPSEPILATFGNKQLVASFATGDGACAMQAVVWNADDIDAKSASRFQVRVSSGQRAEIDGSTNKSITLHCGESAQTLAVVTADMEVAAK